ncbi:protein FAM200A-like [Hydra vulgaris]|uniref:Protein FAM200A-like n=1 Tax=Hydra vulgaris TaxID=6087 RepID=A0ABM4DC99_HYDVU
MDAECYNLLYHTEVRWLSKGNALNKQLASEFNNHFPELSNRIAILVKDPLNAPVTCIPDEKRCCTDTVNAAERRYTHARLMFELENLIAFRSKIAAKCPMLSEMIMPVLLPFVSTYRCECGFSKFTQLNKKISKR